MGSGIGADQRDLRCLHLPTSTPRYRVPYDELNELILRHGEISPGFLADQDAARSLQEFDERLGRGSFDTEELDTRDGGSALLGQLRPAI